MIALAMIVKDDSEVKELDQCLKSVYKFVNKIYITGTNKPDNKIKKLTKEYKGEYSFFKWVDDFSKARNFNFKQVDKKYEYILWLDSDDVVLNAEKIPEIVESMKDKDIDWLNLPYLYSKDKYGRVDARQIKPRILKNGTSKWDKSVHECSSQTKQINLATDNTVIIDHRSKDLVTKSDRNLKILLKEYYKDKDKTDARTIFYIAQTLYGMRKWADAAQFFISYFKKSGWNEEKYFALHALGHCSVQLNELDGAIDTAFNMIKLFPEWSLGYFDLSEYYSLKGEHEKVIEWTLVGLEKDRPFTFNFTNDLDYEYYPMGRLADSYLQIHLFEEANKIAKKLIKKYPDEATKELLESTSDFLLKDKFVQSFVTSVNMIRREDKPKASKMFECLPTSLDDDIRLQMMRFEVVPPKNWGKSIVIYCGKSLENWAYPSIFSGIGGSEEMVIRMSQELTKLGHKVTVFNDCGEYAGIYDGVEYIPYYHFNVKDNYDTLIAWRIPSFFKIDINANKKIVWLHDLAYPEQFDDKATENTDKFIFLSKFHRSNMPSIPDSKIFISNNGIVPDEFKDKQEKKPYSLCWTSSYDRGLLPFMENIFPLIKKEIPEVTLDVAYGWQNIDKEMDIVPEFKNLKEKLVPLLKQEGVTEHGRLNHKQIASLYKTSICMPYASEFGETNNISSQKAQASGCYVITTDKAGATPEYLKFGEIIKGKGIYTDREQQIRFAKAVVKYLKAPKNALGGVVEAFSVGMTARGWEVGLL
ncbi:MAG: glycosyltransferase [Candidatus Heimdallarchaeaceae archaeon]